MKKLLTNPEFIYNLLGFILSLVSVGLVTLFLGGYIVIPAGYEATGLIFLLILIAVVAYKLWQRSEE